MVNSLFRHFAWGKQRIRDQLPTVHAQFFRVIVKGHPRVTVSVRWSCGFSNQRQSWDFYDKCHSSLAELVKLTPMTVDFMVDIYIYHDINDISIVNGACKLCKPTYNCGGSTLYEYVWILFILEAFSLQWLVEHRLWIQDSVFFWTEISTSCQENKITIFACQTTCFVTNSKHFAAELQFFFSKSTLVLKNRWRTTQVLLVTTCDSPLAYCLISTFCHVVFGVFLGFAMITIR